VPAGEHLVGRLDDAFTFCSGSSFSSRFTRAQERFTSASARINSGRYALDGNPEILQRALRLRAQSRSAGTRMSPKLSWLDGWSAMVAIMLR